MRNCNVRLEDINHRCALQGCGQPDTAHDASSIAVVVFECQVVERWNDTLKANGRGKVVIVVAIQTSPIANDRPADDACRIADTIEIDPPPVANSRHGGRGIIVGVTDWFAGRSQATHAIVVDRSEQNRCICRTLGNQLSINVNTLVPFRLHLQSGRNGECVCLENLDMIFEDMYDV